MPTAVGNRTLLGIYDDVFGVSSILNESGNWHPVSASYLGYKLLQTSTWKSAAFFRITDPLEVDREAAGQYQEMSFATGIAFPLVRIVGMPDK